MGEILKFQSRERVARANRLRIKFNSCVSTLDFPIILPISTALILFIFRYVYTDEINLNSFELVCDICYAAKKYMLPCLVEECTKYLWRDLYPRNACRAYEFAKLFEEPVLLDKSMQVKSREAKPKPNITIFSNVLLLHCR